MKMKTIMHFTHTAEKSAYLNMLAERLNRKHFRLIVGTLLETGTLENDMKEMGIKFYSLGAKGKKDYLFSIFRLVNILIKERVDILQTHLFYSSFVGLLAGKIARVPLLVLTRHHSNLTYLFGSRKSLLFDKITAKLAHNIIAVSGAVKKAMEEIDGIDSRKISTVHLGFDFQKMLNVNTDEVEKLRNKYSGNVVFTTVGRFNRYKGFENFIRAGQEIQKFCPNSKFIIIGEGILRSDIEKEIKLHQMENHIELTGWVNNINEYLAITDIFIQPSFSEGFSQVIIEAMAHKKPVIATDVGGAREQIEDGKTGLLVPPGDHHAIASAAKKLLDSSSYAKELGENAHRSVLERFSIEKMIKIYEDLYMKWSS